MASRPQVTRKSIVDRGRSKCRDRPNEFRSREPMPLHEKRLISRCALNRRLPVTLGRRGDSVRCQPPKKMNEHTPAPPLRFRLPATFSLLGATVLSAVGRHHSTLHPDHPVRGRSSGCAQVTFAPSFAVLYSDKNPNLETRWSSSQARFPIPRACADVGLAAGGVCDLNDRSARAGAIRFVPAT